MTLSLPGQVGELSERLPEGGGVGDRHLRPQEDHQGNPDRLRQSRQEKVNKKLYKQTNKQKLRKQHCRTSIYPTTCELRNHR